MQELILNKLSLLTSNLSDNASSVCNDCQLCFISIPVVYTEKPYLVFVKCKVKVINKSIYAAEVK